MITYASGPSFTIAELRRGAMHECMADTLTEAADWTLIRSFIEVVRTGTLSAAARNLGQTQPTIGRQIRRLEELCGEPLFLRTGRELTPTDRAHGLYEAAGVLEQEVTALTRAFAQPAGDGPGVVRITTAEVFAAEALPHLLAPVLADNPGLEIEVIASDRIQSLQRRDADIAVRFGRPTEPELIGVKVGELPVGLFASRELVADRGEPRSAQDLADWPWITTRTGSEVVEGAAAHGLKIEHGRMRLRTDNAGARMGAILAGLGVGAMPLALAQKRPTLMRVLPEVVVHVMPVWLVAHDDLHRSKRLRAVFDGLRSSLGEVLRVASEPRLTPDAGCAPSERFPTFPLGIRA